MTDRPRLLVLRALGLGDFLTGVPAMRALRRAYPDHDTVVEAPSSLDPLVGLAGAADRLLDTRGLTPLTWTGPPPDVAVNLHGKGPQSHAVLSALGPGRLAAFGNTEAGLAGPEWDPHEHEVHRWCRLVSQALGIPADTADLRLPAPSVPAPVPGAVVVHPGAAFPSRRWPPERFGLVARWAASAGHDVVVTGGPDEVELAEEVRRTAGLRAQSVLAGRTDLNTLAAQVASARLLVSGDTGVAHLATAFATPSVVLFGPVPPQQWGPPPDGPHTVVWRGDGPGDPWSEGVDPSLLRVQVEEVVRQAEKLLQPPILPSGVMRPV